jgi:hypothetical protein
MVAVSTCASEGGGTLIAEVSSGADADGSTGTPAEEHPPTHVIQQQIAEMASRSRIAPF